MIKAVFFDFDGILTTDFNGSTTISNNLSRATGLDIEHVKVTYRTHFGHLLKENGTHAALRDGFCAALGKKIDLETLYDALRKFPKNDAMFEVARLLKRNYTVGIITDNSRERMELIALDEQLAEIFDLIIVGGAVEATKGDGTTKIYDVALTVASCEPDESIFIDNQERNLIIPAQMGMNTYWHDDKKNDIQSLRNALVAWGVDLSMS